jgi:hypothetical protein
LFFEDANGRKIDAADSSLIDKLPLFKDGVMLYVKEKPAPAQPAAAAAAAAQMPPPLPDLKK